MSIQSLRERLKLPFYQQQTVIGRKLQAEADQYRKYRQTDEYKWKLVMNRVSKEKQKAHMFDKRLSLSILSSKDCLRRNSKLFSNRK